MQRGVLLLFVWLFFAATSPSQTAEALRGASLWPSSRSAAFIQTDISGGTCPELWSDWPEVQERALARGTVMVWNLSSSIGNLMRTLMYVLPLVRLLEIGLVINVERFPAFKIAFDSGKVRWDMEPEPFVTRATEISKGINAGGLHVLQLPSSTFILDDAQLELFAVTLSGIPGQTPAEIKLGFEKSTQSSSWWLFLKKASLDLAPPCAWNMLLQRSPKMMASMEAHRPWSESGGPSPRNPVYNAWHIRTSDGETAGSFRTKHTSYIFHKQSSARVCPLYLSTVEALTWVCPELFADNGLEVPIYISSNSKSMTRNCSTHAGARDVSTGFVDLGITPKDAHTAFSANPDTPLNAFIDYLYLMDATVIIRTGSSFSGSVVDIKGYKARRARVAHNPANKLYMFMPPVCFAHKLETAESAERDNHAPRLELPVGW